MPKSYWDRFQGYLQRDGYGVYGSLSEQNQGLISCACLAHARRKFVKAQVDNPGKARWFVEQIRQFYLIEKHAREEGLGNSSILLILRSVGWLGESLL